MTLNNDTQLSIFDIAYPKYKITKPIRMITLFSGYDSQCLALKYLGVNYEHWRTCEWAVKSIQALKDIHFQNDNTDYSKQLTIQEIKKYLFDKGISQNYNDPMSETQINRLNEKQARTIYNNIKATHNLVNIQQVKGQDLEIIDREHFTYLLTYSFPCQDLSLAGKGKGMSDTSTRSGMLWEVERILSECNQLKTLPEILVMENVPQVHSEDNKQDFFKWQLRLEELGYKNYVQDLIATDYGIPQTRNRCFMVSILGDYSYQFPKPMPLKLKLKDMLEDEVDEKYYLSDKQVKDIQTWNTYQKPLENMEQIDNSNVSPTLTTRSGAYAAGMILIKNATKQGYLEAEDGDGIDISTRMQYHRGTVQKGKTQTLTTMGGENNGVVVDTLKRDLCNKLIQDNLVEEGDIIKHSYTSQILDGNKKCVEKNDGNMITLTTRGDCFGVVVNPLKGISGKSWQFEQQVYDENGCARTLKASEGSGNIPKVIAGIGEKKSNNGTQRYQQDRIYDDKVAISVTTAFNPYYGIATNESKEWQKEPLEEKSRTILANKSNGGVGLIDTNLRIRKLTPKECFRLMGVKDEDYDKIAKNQSDASLYHLAGDSIVVDVLKSIFKELV